MRVAGLDLNNEKRIDIALTKLYGIGRANVVSLLKKANVDGGIRVKDLNEEETGRVQKVVDEVKVEGDLRAEVSENVKNLREIQAYRGVRHSRNLPVRGQRTRSNARTKRGKRMTIGAIRKEMADKAAAPVAAAKPAEESSKK